MALKDISQVGHLPQLDTAKKATRRSEVEATNEPEDKISVSQMSELEAAVTAAAATAGADRAKVVQELTNAVRQGTYKPDPQKIAQQILEDAKLIAQLRAMFDR
ncbi:MAG: flagellar biosynthesis anti-sigma factor FlgM [Myxococcales bacterium]